MRKTVLRFTSKRRFRCLVSRGVSIIYPPTFAASASLSRPSGLSEPQGVFYALEKNELYVASGGDGTLRIYDGTTLKLRQTLEFGADADNVRYDSHSGQILVGFGSGGLGLVDANGHKVATI